MKLQHYQEFAGWNGTNMERDDEGEWLYADDVLDAVAIERFFAAVALAARCKLRFGYSAYNVDHLNADAVYRELR